MNNDGWGQVGDGVDDKRLEGDDLQHYKQQRPGRISQNYQDGGPMKHHMKRQNHEDHLDESLGMRHGPEREHEQSMSDRRHEANAMHHYLEEERERHEDAIDHNRHHLAKHQGRHYDSQHGHDTYNYR